MKKLSVHMLRFVKSAGVCGGSGDFGSFNAFLEVNKLIKHALVCDRQFLAFAARVSFFGEDR
jgi:hypothetical protein